MNDELESIDPIDPIDRMAADVTAAWSARRACGPPGPGDVVREDGAGVELTVGRVDETVLPPAAWCGLGGGEDLWGARWIPVDRLKVVRRAADPDAPGDDVAEALGDAVDVALECGEVHLGAALVMLLRLREGGREKEAVERLMFLAADSGIGPEGGVRPAWHIREGDVVRPGRGGPAMRVERIEMGPEPPRALCEFLYRTPDWCNVGRTAYFPLDVLARADGSPIAPPTSVRELLDHLRRRPMVRITGPSPGSPVPSARTTAFARFEGGRLWFKDGRHIPLACTLTPGAAASEAGIEFDAAGFVVTKFGVKIRVDYLPSPADG